MEAAARTSYAYWLLTTRGSQISSGRDEQEEASSCIDADDANNHENSRTNSAMREAWRHYLSEHRKYEKALESLREACDFRMEWKLDLLREMGQVSSLSRNSTANDHDREIMERYRGYLEDELGKQPNVVGGHDRQDRAVIVRWGRSNATFDHDGFLLTQIYTAERAIAATEIRSMGKEETIILMVDLANYDRRHVPPISKMMEAFTKLQRLYPERLLHSILLDPPLWARALHATLKPFLSKRTKKRIVIISGQKEKETILTRMIDVANALPVFTNDGKLQADVDIQRFLTGTLFHSTYD